MAATTSTPPATPQADPAPAPLLRLRLAGPEAMAVVGVCRARVLRHQQEREEKEKGNEGDDELEEAARELTLYEDGHDEVSLAQLRAVRAVLRRLATPLAGDGEDGGGEEQQQQGEGDAGPRAEKVFQERVLKGVRLVFPRHAERKAEAQARLKAKEAWRQRLVARSQQREYDRMVKNVHWGGQRKPDAETRPFYQASIAFNMIAAMVTAGFLGYYVSGSINLKETHRIMVGTVTAMGMLMVEMVLYIIRTCEVERYQPKRQRNEEMGQKGLTIPVADPLDDFQFWRMAGQGGRAQQRQRQQRLTPPVGAGVTTTTAVVEKASIDEPGVAGGGGKGEEMEPLLKAKDKDV